MQMKSAQLNLILFPFLFLLTSSVSHSSFAETASNAQKLNISVIDEVKKSAFSIGAEYASLSTSKPLSGMGVSLAYSYGFSKNWAFQSALTQVFNTDFGSLYTGLMLATHYAVFGSFIYETHELRNPEGVIQREAQSQEKTFSIGVGAEELLLTGNSQIYPASGLTGQLGYSFPAFSRWIAAQLRAGSFSSNSKLFSAFFLKLCIPMEL